MTCQHLRQLYRFCKEQDLRLELGSSDLIRIVCHECGIQDVCPSMLSDEYEARNPDEDREGGDDRAPDAAS